MLESIHQLTECILNSLLESEQFICVGAIDLPELSD